MQAVVAEIGALERNLQAISIHCGALNRQMEHRHSITIDMLVKAAPDLGRLVRCANNDKQ
jgi:hypothetical protein